MQAVTTIGLDIAKSVFQVHGVDSGGQVVLRRQLKRRYVLAFFEKLPPCLVGIEACPLGASLVARTAIAWPHRSPDAADLREALCEAA
jgi:transposase